MENLENEQLKKKLCEKVEQELNNFKEQLKQKSPEEIIENSYKLVCMMGINEYLSYECNCSNFELKALLKTSNLLEECYDTWLSSDGNLREALEYSVDDTIENIREDAVKRERKNDAR